MKPQRSTDPEVSALARRLPSDEAWVIVAYFGPKAGKSPGLRSLVASTSFKAANLPRQIALDMPDSFDTCTLVGWSDGVNPGELGF
jgi:hypothetical protein